MHERKRAPRRRWPPTEGSDCHVGRRRDCSNLRADGMTDISFKSASALAADIKAKKIGCREALDYFWSRVERFNPQINAIVVSDIDRARARASDADAAIARGEVWGPLHGVPTTVKESFDIIGLPTTWGLPLGVAGVQG